MIQYSGGIYLPALQTYRHLLIDETDGSYKKIVAKDGGLVLQTVSETDLPYTNL